MADLLIKGMEMPECCNECPLLLAYGSRLENKIIHHCMGRLPEDSRFADDADLTERPKEGCPLVEVKAHGRLIDADELVGNISDTYCEECPKTKPIMCKACEYEDIMDDIENAPTVLEAST